MDKTETYTPYDETGKPQTYEEWLVKHPNANSGSEQRNEAGQFVKGNTEGQKSKKQKTSIEIYEQILSKRHPTEKGTYSRVIIQKLIDKAIEGDIKALLKVIDIMDRIDNRNNPYGDIL